MDLHFTNTGGASRALLEANGLTIAYNSLSHGYGVRGPFNQPGAQALWLLTSGAWAVGGNVATAVGELKGERNADIINETLTSFAWKWRQAFPGWDEHAA